MAGVQFRVTRMRISSRSVEAAMRTPKVRTEIEKVAERARARVEALGAAEGARMDATTESTTRPKGRPAVNVVSPNTGQEWGDKYSARLRVLGRVAEEMSMKKRGG